MSICATYHELTALVYSTHPDKPKPNVSIDIFEYFKNLSAWGYDGFQYPYANERFCGLLSDIQFDDAKKAVFLVFTVADVQADCQIARDLTTNTTRILSRKNGEAADSRVNVVVKVNPSNASIANIALEHQRGLPISKFLDTLNYLFRDARINKYPEFFVGDHPFERYQKGEKTGQPKPLKFKPKFEIKSVVDEQVIKAFQEGRINHIDFFKSAQNGSAFDTTGHFRQDRIKVSMKVETQIIKDQSASWAEKAQDIYETFFTFKQQHFDMLGSVFTIDFKDNHGHNRTAQYDVEDQSFTIVKKEYFPEELRQPMTDVVQVNTALCARMLAKI